MEIKFRGRHVHIMPQNEHLDGTWVYGYLSDENYINSPELEGEFLVDPETVCQYTGYTDPRKTKVFEHDIIFYENEQAHGEIVFENGQFLIKWDASHLRQDIHFWFVERTVYVVGNIFENADLLQN